MSVSLDIILSEITNEIIGSPSGPSETISEALGMILASNSSYSLPSIFIFLSNLSAVTEVIEYFRVWLAITDPFLSFTVYPIYFSFEKHCCCSSPFRICMEPSHPKYRVIPAPIIIRTKERWKSPIVSFSRFRSFIITTWPTRLTASSNNINSNHLVSYTML